MVKSLVILCGVLCAGTLVTGTARAELTKTTPSSGVTHIHRWNVIVRDAVQDYHVVLVDLANPGLRFAVTKESDRTHTTSWYGANYGAELAVNGSMFEFPDRNVCGPTKTAGAYWTRTWTGCPSSIGFAPGAAKVFANDENRLGPFPAAGSFAIDGLSGTPWLVRDGKNTGPWTQPASINLRRARTAAGITQTGKTLILVVADGERATALGMSGADVALVFSEFEAWNALNLDGTGSSALWMKGEGGLQNRPSEGSERQVGNALVLVPVVVPPMDGGADAAPAADAARDGAVDASSDVATLVPDAPYEGGPEDPTGDAGEPADASIYEGASEGVPTALPPSVAGDASGCACRAMSTTEMSTRTGSFAVVLAAALVAVSRVRRRLR